MYRVWWLMSVVLVAGCAGAPPAISDQLVLHDPAGDDHGPGGYVYPQSDVYRSGALDLRQVRLTQDGDTVLVEAVFDGPVAMARGVRLAREQVVDLFVPTVDLYIAFSTGSAAGGRECLTGRGVRVASAARWDLAIVLSPIPGRLSEALGDRLAGSDVVVPSRVRVRGKALRARVPASHFQGHSISSLGVAAAVTGTVYGTTFRTLVDGFVPTAFVREVTQSAGRCDRWEEDLDGAPCTFGGCGACVGHPRVLDALHPEAGVQEKTLSEWDGRLGRLAVLPMVWADGRTAGPEESPVVRSASVVDRRDGLVTVRVADGGLPGVGSLLDGLDASGAVVGTLVVRKRIDAPESPLLILEVVAGEGSEVVSIQWVVKVL